MAQLHPLHETLGRYKSRLSGLDAQIAQLETSLTKVKERRDSIAQAQAAIAVIAPEVPAAKPAPENAATPKAGASKAARASRPDGMP